MHNWNDIHHDQQRRTALLHDADNARLAASAHPPRLHQRRLRPFVAWAGRQMVTAGYRLLTLAREWDYPANTMYNEAHSTVQQP